jgi:hypothetical protein
MKIDTVDHFFAGPRCQHSGGTGKDRLPLIGRQLFLGILCKQGRVDDKLNQVCQSNNHRTQIQHMGEHLFTLAMVLGLLVTKFAVIAVTVHWTQNSTQQTAEEIINEVKATGSTPTSRLPF